MYTKKEKTTCTMHYNQEIKCKQENRFLTLKNRVQILFQLVCNSTRFSPLLYTEDLQLMNSLTCSNQRCRTCLKRTCKLPAKIVLLTKRFVMSLVSLHGCCLKTQCAVLCPTMWTEPIDYKQNVQGMYPHRSKYVIYTYRDIIRRGEA